MQLMHKMTQAQIPCTDSFNTITNIYISPQESSKKFTSVGIKIKGKQLLITNSLTTICKRNYGARDKSSYL